MLKIFIMRRAVFFVLPIAAMAIIVMMVMPMRTHAMVAERPGGVAGGIELWLRAGTDVFSDSGTTAATNGSSVEQWNDLIGINHSSQTTPTQQPVLMTDAINFNPALELDGVDDFLQGTAGFNNDQVFAVVAPSTTVSSSSPAGYIYGMDGSSLHGLAFGDSNTLLALESIAYLEGFTYRSGDMSGVHTSPSIYETQLASGSVDIFTNWQQVNTVEEAAGTAAQFADADYTLGATATGTKTLNGQIAEFISFSTPLTSAERLQVTSYLALKYGITIDQTTPTNYVAGDGTTVIWDAATAAGHNNDIAGIGQDDNSALLQTQSKSINPATLLTVSNPSDLQDMEFLSWSHDGESLLGSDNVPAGLTSRFIRTWRMQEVGDVGTVDIQIDIGPAPDLSLTDPNQYKILVDADGDFSDATEYDTGRIIDAVNQTISFTGIPINDGDYVTLSGVFAAPGAVQHDLSLWLRADSDVFSNDLGSTAAGNNDTVAVWDDQTGRGNDAVQSSSARKPTLQDSSINFNPAITFDGTDDFLSSNGGFYNNEVFIVAEPDQDVTKTSERQYIVAYNTDSWRNGYVFGPSTAYIHNETVTYLEGLGLDTDYRSGVANTVINRPAIVGSSFSSSAVDMFIDGLQANDLLFDAHGPPTGQSSVNYRVGASNIDQYHLDGKVSEIISYKVPLTTVERNQVNSYLAIKYGITLDQSTPQNYVGSAASNIVWDATASGEYNHDIAGIGIDSKSSLQQPMSRSINNDSIITMSAPSDLQEEEFLVWSNDNEPIDTWSVIPGSSDKKRLLRTWRVEENNGDVGMVQIAAHTDDLPGDADDSYFIYVADDPEMTTNLQVIPMTNTAGALLSDPVNLADGAYFTVVSTVIVEIIAHTDGTEGFEDVTFTIDLGAMNNTSSPATVSYSFSGGSASAGTDYNNTATTIDIPVGEQQATTTISVIDDSDAEGDETLSITLQSVSFGVISSVLSEQTRTATIYDNDVAGVYVDSTGLSSSTSESSGDATFTIQLFVAPTADVVIHLSSSDTTEASVPATVTIPVADWSTPYEVTVSGVNDDIIDGPQEYTISVDDISSGDASYDALDGTSVNDVIGSNEDDDVAGVIIEVVNNQTTEAGGTAIVRFSLTAQPQSDVIMPIGISDDTEAETSPVGELVFDDTNWNDPSAHEVVITGLDDTDVDGPVVYTFETEEVISADNAFDALGADDVADVSLINLDDDSPGGLTDDGDGVPAAVEDAGPNDGDANGDGVLDSLQPHVATTVNSGTGVYSTLIISTECVIVNFSLVYEESLAVQDPSNTYPVGLDDYTIKCPVPGMTVPVTIIFDGEYDTSSWGFQLYNRYDSTYTDMSSHVAYSQITVAGTSYTTVEYSITDGGLFDEDGVADMYLIDPSGPALAVVNGVSNSPNDVIESLAETGRNIRIALIVGMLVSTSVVLVTCRSGNQSARSK